MKHIFTKVTAFILIAIFISACNAVKRVPNGKFLLTKNEIFQFNLLTNVEQVPEGTALYNDRVLGTNKK